MTEASATAEVMRILKADRSLDYLFDRNDPEADAAEAERLSKLAN